MSRISTGHSAKSLPSTNARRCSPSNSLSLPPEKKQRIRLNAGPNNRAFVARRVTALGENSGGESGNDLGGSQWFEQSNKNISQSLRDATDFNSTTRDSMSQETCLLFSAEPPFFMRNQPEYSFTSNGSERLFGGFLRDDSETDDLRGVIDDLTVENKRLKQLLRRWRGRKSSSMAYGDKLFEVRMHGLPPERKRELELLLQNFASSIERSIGFSPNFTAMQGRHNQSSNSLLSSCPVSNNNTKHVPTDSGYGSNSGQALVTPWNARRLALPVSRVSSDNTFPHDVPDMLLPRPPLILSERSKMALVVRRLEQLFRSRTAVPREHSQPILQQEISQSAQSAARAGQRAHGEKNMSRAEGTREARILPHDSINIDVAERQHVFPKKLAKAKDGLDHGSDDSDQSTSESVGCDLSQPISGQRPTHPLDLDIDRQATPSDNIDYIRHLGLSPNHADGESEGWMYLNLLASMAQLHTINVPPDFIRRAIKKCSTKFELSKDGHKVRWIGGSNTTISLPEKRSVESANNTDQIVAGSANWSNAFTSLTPPEDKSMGEQMSDASKQFVPRPASKRPTIAKNAAIKPASDFDYQPIVFTGRPLTSPDDSTVDSSSTSNERFGFDSCDLVQALSKSNLNQHHPDEGMIIFYRNNRYFCSDFSGDQSSLDKKLGVSHDDGDILGVPPSGAMSESPLRYHDACYFSPQFAVGSFDVSDEDIPSFTPPPMPSAGQVKTLPIDLPASGIGGVMPEDNFALDVEIERTQASHSTIGRPTHCRGTVVQPGFDYRVVNADKVDLRPSPLPSPSYVVLRSSSSFDISGVMEMFEDSNDEGSIEEGYPAAPSFLRNFSNESSRNRGTSDGSEKDGDKDRSVDMVAARAADLEIVAAREREYVIYHSGRLDGVPGSLVVTAGTRSCDSGSQGDIISSRVDEDGSESDQE